MTELRSLPWGVTIRQDRRETNSRGPLGPTCGGGIVQPGGKSTNMVFRANSEKLTLIFFSFLHQHDKRVAEPVLEAEAQLLVLFGQTVSPHDICGNPPAVVLFDVVLR